MLNQAGWKSGKPFLSYKQKTIVQKKTEKQTNIEKLCVFTGEMYLTICVECTKIDPLFGISFRSFPLFFSS